MTEPISRREALRKLALLVGGAAMVEVSAQAHAADLPHLSGTDPTAVALNYTGDAASVDPKKFPSYRPGQKCDSCLQLQGKEGQPWRPCNLFPGKLVNANGWCKVWVPKS
ncbi:MAG: high-potential iron-sulfur protein [Steroidobacteraceae bacterium]